jgi:hypothetical protein
MKLRSLNTRRIGALMFSLCAFGLLTSPSMWEIQADDGWVGHALDDEVGRVL